MCYFFSYNIARLEKEKITINQENKRTTMCNFVIWILFMSELT